MIPLALGLGLVIGLTLGALGGGGSILAVPALVFALGLSAQEATTASLVIVGVTAAAAAVGHARSGHTRWGAGAVLAGLGVPASLLGTRLNTGVASDVLLLAFAALMVVAAAGMLLTAGPREQGSPDAMHPPPRAAGRRWGALAAAALGIGFLTGFLGVGGGFVVVPVLVVLLGMPMPVAVGTSLLVIALNCAVALVSRTGTGLFVWEVIAPFAAAAVAGSLLGKLVADRLAAAALTRAFALLLLVVAGYVVVQSAG